MKTLNIYKVQMAYFFRERSNIRAFGLISSLYTQFKEIFKTEPQSLPVPEDAPANVPRCIWNDVNISLTFNKERLDFSFNIPSKLDWEQALNGFNKNIMQAIDEQEIIIDRVGLVSELMTVDRLHNILLPYIQIEQFNSAKEANISWLENVESYNVWTYFVINESQDINKIMFDINSLPEYKLADQGVAGIDAMNKCARLLKGKMENVL